MFGMKLLHQEGEIKTCRAAADADDTHVQFLPKMFRSFILSLNYMGARRPVKRIFPEPTALSNGLRRNQNAALRSSGIAKSFANDTYEHRFRIGRN
jgi:hypothetical protein